MNKLQKTIVSTGMSLVLASSTLPVQAEEWLEISRNNNITYINQSNIESLAEFRYIYTSTVFSKPRNFGFLKRSATTLLEYHSVDCNKKVYRTRTMIYYDSNNKVILQRNLGDNGQLKKVSSGTPLAKAVSFACNKTTQSQPLAANESSSTLKAEAEKFLARYFDAAINQGYSGYVVSSVYWCPDTKELASSLFSPRRYKILSVSDPVDSPPIIRFVVAVDSTNKGGQPIATNWLFYVKKNNDRFCLYLLSEIN